MSEQRAYAPLPPAPPSGYAPLPQAPSPIDHALALGGAASLPQSNVGASLASPQISPVDISTPTAAPAAAPVAAQAPPQAADPLGFAYNVIGKGETGNDPDAAHRLYGARPGYFGFPDWQGAQGPAGPTHAAGTVQWEPDTWKQAATAYVNAGNPTPDFNKAEDQEKVFRFWAPLEYAKATRGRNLAQDIAAGVDWKTPLAATWPSLIPHSLHNPTRPDLNGLIASAQQAGDERRQYMTGELSNIQGEMDRYKQIAESAPPGSREMDEALARQTELSERAAKTFDELAAHPPVYSPKDVMQRFGSLATVIAVLGGLKSRQPLTAALNASGQAMKAINQNNYDNYKIAYDAWKTQSDLVVQSLRAHSEAINQILANKRFSQEEKNSELNALATVTGNEFLKAKLAAGEIQAPFQMQLELSQLADTLQKNQMALDKMNIEIDKSKGQQEHMEKQNTLLDFQIKQLGGDSPASQTANSKPGDPNSAMSADGSIKKPDNVSDGIWEAAKIYVLTGKEPPSTWGGATRQAIMNEIPVVRSALGLSEKEMIAGWSSVTGLTSAQRALGTRLVSLDTGIREAEHTAPLVLQASKAVPRYQIMSLNSLLLAADRQTGDPNVVRLGIAIKSFLNAYAKGINPTGRLTDSQQNHAYEMLEKAMAQGQIEAGIDQLKKELVNYRSGLMDAQKDVKSAFGFTPTEPTLSANPPSGSTIYTSPDDVYKAYDAGTLTKEQAKQTLIDKFGFKPQ